MEELACMGGLYGTTVDESISKEVKKTLVQYNLKYVQSRKGLSWTDVQSLRKCKLFTSMVIYCIKQQVMCRKISESILC